MIKRKTKLGSAVIFVLSILLIAGTALAQGKSGENVQYIFLQKVKADKKMLIAENLQFTESEAKAFWPIYYKYQDELFLLRVRTGKLIQEYADNYDKLNDARAKKLLDESLVIESLRLKLIKSYLPKFRKALPEKKVARYYQLENKINAALYNEFAEKIPLVSITDNKK